MNRREAIKKATALLGVPISLPLINAVLSKSYPSATAELRTLSANQDRLVTMIAERIIPTTDTPGATDAKVNMFIDLMLTEWYPPKDRTRFLEGLEQLDGTFRGRHQQAFVEGSEQNQMRLLHELDAEAMKVRVQGRTPTFFAMMKELTLVGYYTSQIGMLQELQFQPATSEYKGCIELEDVDNKTWARLRHKI